MLEDWITQMENHHLAPIHWQLFHKHWLGFQLWICTLATDLFEDQFSMHAFRSSSIQLSHKEQTECIPNNNSE